MKNPSKKVKTNKSIAKRFKITKTGKVLYRPSGINHFLAKKTTRQKNRNAGYKELTGALATQIKAMMRYK